MNGTVLVVDDIAANRNVLRQTLETDRYEVLAVPDGSTALRVAIKSRPDVILLDVMMPGMDGLETCRRLKADPDTLDIPVLFISARSETQTTLDGFRAGAVDYITKPFQSDEVLARVRTHLTNHRLTREVLEKNRQLEEANTRLREEMNRRQEAESSLELADAQLSLITRQEIEAWGLPSFVGRSLAMQRVIRDIRNLQLVDSTPVVITGESGTGKELVARALHFSGRRRKKPFIAVNCAAIPGDLAESLFFGHVKGAFSGASAARRGYFELADTGTLFLDEFADLPLPLQPKLLRAIENGTFLPLGADKERHVDVRVVAATNADLSRRIAVGQLREDLFFRVNGYEIKLQPLRDRRDDIELLIHHFLERFARESNRVRPPLAESAKEALLGYRFPGNIRELKTILERAMIESRGGTILLRHLHLRADGAAIQPEPAAHEEADREDAQEIPLNLNAAQVALVRRALRHADGNVSKAADLLGINRTRIYRILSSE